MIKQVSAIVLLSSLSAFSYADMKPHMYASVAVGNADYDFPGDVSDTSFSLLGGYYFSQNLSLEGGYTDLGGEDGFSASVISLALKGSYPINEMFSLYAKAGIGFGTVDFDDFASEDNTDLTYGVGASFRVAEQATINIGYDMFSLGDEISVDVSVIALGASFHF